MEFLRRLVLNPAFANRGLAKRGFANRAFAASLLLAGAAVAGAQTNPTLLYGTSTSVVNDAPFAVAATAPNAVHPRSQFVVAAEKDANANLHLQAWQDTGTSLVLTSSTGTLPISGGLAAFAVTGLDGNHVVTAAIDGTGRLFMSTWTVNANGITLLASVTSRSSTATKSVAITAPTTGTVVTAYDASNGTLIVRAWTIAGNGLPTPEATIGSGSIGSQVSIATVNPNQVITASNNSAQTMYVSTWGVTSGGVALQDQVILSNTVNTTPQAIAVAAGQAPDANGNVVQSAFTPFINPESNLGVYYWTISASGLLTLQTIPNPTRVDPFYGVAAAMLPGNFPMTSFWGGTGGGYLFVEDYTPALNGYPNPTQFGPSPANLSSIASVSEGGNTNPALPKSGYFISAVAYGQLNPSPNGTLYIEVFRYP